jgi:cytochrome c oxidase assembly factor CtaG
MKKICIVAIALLAPVAAYAHTGEPLAPHDLMRAWEFDPGVVIPLMISAALYLVGSRRQFGITRLQKTCFWMGWWSLAAALISPIHPLGEVLFSAHMVQHEMLMLIAAPLLVLSRPLVAFLWGMPVGWRRTAGKWAKQNYVRKSWVFLTEPFTAWWLHAAAIWAWHAPFLFQLTLTSESAHTAQHLSFFLSALLFWWALFYARGRKSYGTGVLYVFTTAVHTSVLGALLTFAPHVWYPAYLTTTQVWGLSPVEDQQLGGLIMWVPASLVYVIAGLALLAAWIKESDAMLERASHAE